MIKYIALLRGINVSGQKKIKMAELKEALTTQGLGDVQTYIQSGNIVFESALTEADAAVLIQKCILDEFGFEVPTLVLRQDALPPIIADNPFVSKEEETKKLYFCFLKVEPTMEGIQTLAAADTKGDEYYLIGQMLYLCYHSGAGKTKMDNNFLEKKLKVSATSRNWNTVNKLAEM
ncbi:MAG: DUF1697 domain-containing protein [Reichenbachiella sp.]